MNGKGYTKRIKEKSLRLNIRDKAKDQEDQVLEGSEMDVIISQKFKEA